MSESGFFNSPCPASAGRHEEYANQRSRSTITSKVRGLSHKLWAVPRLALRAASVPIPLPAVLDPQNRTHEVDNLAGWTPRFPVQHRPQPEPDVAANALRVAEHINAPHFAA